MRLSRPPVSETEARPWPGQKKSASWFLTALTLWFIFLAAVAAGGQEFSEYGNPFTWVRVGQARVKAEVVTAPEKIFRGLGYRPNLPEGRGMLFLMPEVAMQVFCMRGMEFAIDILWLVPGRVVGLEKNISPQYKGDLTSPEPVNYVLEVPAGFCDRYGVKVGDEVSW
jgi:uncharacterized membrane protein (UPF0127 family)